MTDNDNRIGIDTHGLSEQEMTVPSICFDYSCIHYEDDKCINPEKECQYEVKEECK